MSPFIISKKPPNLFDGRKRAYTASVGVVGATKSIEVFLGLCIKLSSRGSAAIAAAKAASGLRDSVGNWESYLARSYC
jgi:hypothetical protein